MACSTQVMNQVIESQQDKIMKRTSNRPVASGRVSKIQGSCLAGLLGAASLGIFSQFGTLTCITASGIWLGYIGLYVPLKKITRFNTHVGAVVGAAPAYLGWVTATGTFAGVEPLLLASHIFAWQFPHVYGIAWTYRTDFLNVGFKMITDVDPDGRKSFNSALLGNFGQLATAAGLVITGSIHPVFFLAGTAYCFGSVFEALQQFKSVRIKQFPNSLTGAKLMISSYKTIGTMFLVMICSWVYKTLGEKWAWQKEQTKKEIRKYEHYK
jgi:heme O synthase-like polyprenyltransferase